MNLHWNWRTWLLTNPDVAPLPRQQNFCQGETLYNGDHCARDALAFVEPVTDAVISKYFFSIP